MNLNDYGPITCLSFGDQEIVIGNNIISINDIDKFIRSTFDTALYIIILNNKHQHYFVKWKYNGIRVFDFSNPAKLTDADRNKICKILDAAGATRLL